MTERSLKNKVVVITGGATGIGFEIADNYLKNSAKVTILVDINKTQGEEAVKKLNKKYGADKSVFYKGDVTNEKELDEIYTKVIHTYKNVDVLVNNAGILNEIKWKETIDINVKALIAWTIKFWEHMRKDKGGKGGTIINLASIYGFRVDQYLPVYQASKFAVFGFTKSLGHMYNYTNYGVRVVAICPGFTKTELTVLENVHIWEGKERRADFDKFVKENDWQDVEAVGKAAVDTFENADSGTAWLIEGNKPIEQVYPD